MTHPQQTRHDHQIAVWLIVCAAVIFSMVILGGVTRLTHSGLSMVDWKPITGIIPPLNESAWLAEFEKYKQFPEYQIKNVGMSLDEFKSIFYFEYAHRVLGRLIGVLFFFPLLYFVVARKVKQGLLGKLLLMFFLGGLQGLLGWYMVKSGLVNDPHVSQYRLTAHLGLAVLVYGFILWVAFGLVHQARVTADAKLLPYFQFSKLISGLVFLMILSGGLVAGTRAGLAYSTWPLMGDVFIPAGMYTSTPAWLEIFEDITTIQFNHRIFAYLLFLLITPLSLLVIIKTRIMQLRRAAIVLLIILLVQLTLGITTLLFHVPVALGAAHQGGAVLLFTAALYLCHRLQVHSRGSL